MNIEHSAQALEPIRETLRADQMDLSIEEGTGDGALRVEVVVDDDSCVDCLVPEPMLRQIIEKRLAESGVAYSSLDFRYPDTP